jgi:hypothetical protein
MVFDLLIRDFGVKVHKKDFEFLRINYNMSQDDFNRLRELCSKYKFAEPLLYDFPGWYVNYARKEICNSMKMYLRHLFYADVITVTSNETYALRKYHFIEAKAEIHLMVEEFEYIMKVYPINPKLYLPVLDQMNRVIYLIEKAEKLDTDRWRKWREKKNKRKPEDPEMLPMHSPTYGISKGKDWTQINTIRTPFDNTLGDPFDAGAQDVLQMPSNPLMFIEQQAENHSTRDVDLHSLEHARVKKVKYDKEQKRVNDIWSTPVPAQPGPIKPELVIFPNEDEYDDEEDDGKDVLVTYDEPVVDKYGNPIQL